MISHLPYLNASPEFTSVTTRFTSAGPTLYLCSDSGVQPVADLEETRALNMLASAGLFPTSPEMLRTA